MDTNEAVRKAVLERQVSALIIQAQVVCVREHKHAGMDMHLQTIHICVVREVS